MISLICRIKKRYRVVIYKTEVERNLWLPGDGGRINWEIWIHNTTVYIIDNNRICYKHRDLSSVLCNDLYRKGINLKKKARVNMGMSLTGLLSYTTETNRTCK